MKITKQFTNRESKSLDQYLQEIGKVDLLTPDMEIELAIQIKKVISQTYSRIRLRAVIIFNVYFSFDSY